MICLSRENISQSPFSDKNIIFEKKHNSYITNHILGSWYFKEFMLNYKTVNMNSDIVKNFDLSKQNSSVSQDAWLITMPHLTNARILPDEQESCTEAAILSPGEKVVYPSVHVRMTGIVHIIILFIRWPYYDFYP